MERLEYDLLFRWFVGIGADDAGVGSLGVFEEPGPAAGRRHRGEVLRRGAGAAQSEKASLDHFSVDGTLIEAWPSMKSVKPGDGAGEPPENGGSRNAEADFHGQKRTDETHASTTDPDARLYKKGKERRRSCASAMPSGWRHCT